MENENKRSSDKQQGATDIDTERLTEVSGEPRKWLHKVWGAFEPWVIIMSCYAVALVIYYVVRLMGAGDEVLIGTAVVLIVAYYVCERWYENKEKKETEHKGSIDE